MKQLCQTLTIILVIKSIQFAITKTVFISQWTWGNH